PVVVREEYCIRSFFWRQRLIRTADQGSEFAPAEHFSIELWQTAERQLLVGTFRSKAEEALIGSEALDGKEGNDKWEQWHAQRNNADKQRRAQASGREPRLQCDGSAGEENGIGAA